MKVENIDIRLQFASGTLPEPDSMNRTQLLVNQELVWPYYAGYGDSPMPQFAQWGDFREFDPAEIDAGDWVMIVIPSGILEGPVHSAWETDGRVYVQLRPATWDGRAGGLAGGMSGCCGFTVLNAMYPRWATASGTKAIVTESSTIDAPVNYGVYEQARILADAAPDQKQELMRQLLAVIAEYL